MVYLPRNVHAKLLPFRIHALDLFFFKYVHSLVNHANSGVWEKLQEIRNDTEKLEDVCTQAHTKSHRLDREMVINGCDKIKLGAKYKSVDMEVLVYTMKELGHKNDALHIVVKGFAQVCLHYLTTEDPQEKVFKLKNLQYRNINSAINDCTIRDLSLIHI